MLQNPPQTFFPPALLWMRPANPLTGRRIECGFSRFFKLTYNLGKFPRVSAGASLLSFGLFPRSVLKIYGVGTALMRTFDLYCIQRWTFAFSDVCLTQRSSCEPHSSKWSQNFCAPPRIVTDSGSSASCDTQPNPRSLVTIPTALLSPPFFGLLLGCSSTFQCGNEHSAPNLPPCRAIPIRF